MKVATWNLMRAMSRRHSSPELLDWLTARTDVDVVVPPEACWPEEDFASRCSSIVTPDRLDSRRGWGTTPAGHRAEPEPVISVRGLVGAEPLRHHQPAAVHVYDVHTSNGLWGTIAGIYGVTDDLDRNKVKHGRISVPQIIAELAPVFRRRTRLVLAGDLNLHPKDKPRRLAEFGLVDVVEATAASRPPLTGCTGCSMGEDCGDIWTHKNRGGRNPSAQNIDFIFASRAPIPQLAGVRRGELDFPDVWEMSHHAPVIATFL